MSSVGDNSMPHYENATDRWFEQWVKDNPGALVEAKPGEGPHAVSFMSCAEDPELCLDCGHVHTPDGCIGEPTPSDRWAGVSPSICDCADPPPLAARPDTAEGETP